MLIRLGRYWVEMVGTDGDKEIRTFEGEESGESVAVVYYGMFLYWDLG